MKTEIWDLMKKEWMLILVYLLMGIFIGQKCKGQRWQDSNRGLYPQSIQTTYNIRNTALGVRYGYLIQKPVLGMPLGIYGSFSNTINPYWNNNVGNNNYDWERKYSIGSSVQLHHSIGMHSIHTFFTIAGIYNSHPTANSDKVRPPGQFTAGYYHITDWGCDIGIEQQINHVKWNLTVDFVNFLEYVEFGVGYTFFKLNK